MTLTEDFIKDWNGFTGSIVALKSSTNPHYKNKYAPLDVWLEQVHIHAAKYNFTVSECTAVRESTQGDLYMLHTVNVRHISGEELHSTYLVGMVDKPQAMGSALTYARRYNLQTVLTCTGELDDDAEQAQVSSVIPMTRKKLN
jgi:hypothetical protein